MPKIRRAWDRFGEQGQLLVGVMLLLVLMTVMVPVMVFYTQREAKWTAKQDQTTTAFHLAEAGIEKGYRALSRSTGTWFDLVDEGIPIDNFHFDKVFDDISGGNYIVAIASGPGTREATVISVGRDSVGGQVRALRAVFGQNILGDVAIHAMDGVNVNGNNVQVEWGAVVSPEPLAPGTRTRPQFWSASEITGLDTNPDPPNCDEPDCCQWFSFSPDVPPNPGVDLNFYRSSAAGSSCGFGANNDPPGSCYFDGDESWSVSTDYTEGGTVFIEGDLYVGKDLEMIGNLLVTGNFSTKNGGWGKSASKNLVMPTTAWKQYCRNWAAYNFNDATKPATFPGLDSTYRSAEGHVYADSKVAVEGFFYIGGDFNETGGGGNSVIYGAMFVEGTVNLDMNSQFRIYYNKEASEKIRSTRLILVRRSWQAEVRPWPI